MHYILETDFMLKLAPEDHKIPGDLLKSKTVRPLSLNLDPMLTGDFFWYQEIKLDVHSLKSYQDSIKRGLINEILR